MYHEFPDDIARKYVNALIVVVLSLLSGFGVLLQAQVGPPPIVRTLHKKDIERYAVVMDWEGDMGKAHYEFELKLQSAQPDDQSPYEKVTVSFGHLKASYDGRVAPQTKNFGSASFRFTQTGFPEGIQIGGSNGMFVLPILSWFVPKDPVGADSSFQIPDTEFEGKVHVSGSGNYLKGKGQEANIKLDLNIDVTDKPTDVGNIVQGFTSEAKINTKTGMMISSQGEIQMTSGKIAFKVKRA